MKKLITLIILLTAVLFSQEDKTGYSTATGYGGGGGSIANKSFWSVDLNGADEYAYRTYAAADSFFNVNGYERFQNSNSRDFESTVGSWVNKGNHSIDTNTANKIYGVKSGQIISTGAGDSLSNFVGIVASATGYHGVTDGNKYTFEFWSKSLYTVAGDSIVFYHGGFRKAFPCSTVAQKRVVNYTATSYMVLHDTIKIYSKVAIGDTIVIDSSNYSRANDLLINVWVYNRGYVSHGSSANVILGKGDALNTGKGFAISYELGNAYKFSINDSVVRATITASSAFTLNTWRLLTCVVKKDSGIFLYENGVLTASNTTTALNVGITKSNFSSFGIGYDGFSISRSANALIGEVQIIRFNNIGQSNFTTASPLAIYNAYTLGRGFTNVWSGGTPKVVVWYDWLDATSDAKFLQDLSGNGYNLTGSGVTTADQSRWKR